VASVFRSSKLDTTGTLVILVWHKGCLMRSAMLSIPVAILAGLVIGLGSYTFIYAKGDSYLTNNPVACTNCHVMQSQ